MIRYKKKKSNAPFIITVIVLLLLIFFSYRNPEGSQIPSKALNTVISPINSVFYSLSNSARQLYDQLFGSRETRDYIQELEAKNEELADQVRDLKLVIGDQEALKTEYELIQKNKLPMVQALVSSQDPASISRRFTIDKGKNAGVQVGDIVVEGVKEGDRQAQMGLVGRVEEVGPNFAKVTTIMDQSRNLSVSGLTSRALGIVNGRDGSSLHGYLMEEEVPLEKGEEMVTAGRGGVFPRGILVGTVREVTASADELTQTFILEPAVAFHRLYRVLVIPAASLAEVGERILPAPAASTAPEGEKASQDQKAGEQASEAQKKDQKEDQEGGQSAQGQGEQTSQAQAGASAQGAGQGEGSHE